jgi:hypothetical protein
LHTGRGAAATVGAIASSGINSAKALKIFDMTGFSKAMGNIVARCRNPRIFHANASKSLLTLA